ncbi:hypothetical protein GCM10023156_29170 [Novipirellula rosea]|uniref:Helix-turn-helix domain-containing protein n=2 Tax=Novipirellula rosea TaxID=1031540 RepID=A0ABP8MV96_9BACT
MIQVQEVDLANLTEAVASAVYAKMQPLLATASAPRLVDGDRLAELLGVSRPTVDRMRSSGEIPSVSIGRRRLYDPNAVIAALGESSNEKGAASD